MSVLENESEGDSGWVGKWLGSSERDGSSVMVEREREREREYKRNGV